MIGFDIASSVLNPDGRLIIHNGIVIMLYKGSDDHILIDNKKYTLSRNSIEILPENHIVEHLSQQLVEHKSVMTVQQIADHLNFSSPSAFVQFFKKHTGKTPRNL